MRLRTHFNWLLTLSAMLLLAITTQPAHAQLGGGGGGGGQNQVLASGVAVDAEGVLRRTTTPDPTGELTRQRIQEAQSRLQGDLAKPSKLRKVSLTRLEKLLKEKIAAGTGADATMLGLAGLTRIDYVFCYPSDTPGEPGDVVLAGPAEPWAQAPSGRMLGIESGQPIIELQDMIAALRAFPAGSSKDNPLIYCSIDPTPEGLSRMQQFLQQFGRNATPNDTQFIVEQLREKLGLQVITVGGMPATTHFAQVLVEADYRMKLIGIGLEKPPVRLTSYVDRANAAMVSRNAMQRWFFVPDYDRLRVSEDGLAMEIEGEGVKLIGEDEFIGQDGTRRSVGRSNRASNAFTKAFTKVYNRMADKSPVYAQLRNCIDLAVAAAFIQDQDYYTKAEWTPEVFYDESAHPIETYNAPQQVATAVNSMWKGNTLMTPVGGGVEIRPTLALKSENLKSDAKGEVEKQRAEVDLSKLAADQWWWD